LQYFGPVALISANRKLRERLQARDGNLLEVIRKGEALSFGEWSDSFLKNFWKPPIRAAKTHEVNIRVTYLKAAFVGRKLVELTADAIEEYLRDRLEQRVRVRFKGGYREKGPLKSTTVHQEFRVAWAHVEHSGPQEIARSEPLFGGGISGRREGTVPTALRHVVGQERIESHGPEYLRNIVQIITECESIRNWLR
jgi:hypothetical protein